jgi:hypothetical protein
MSRETAPADNDAARHGTGDADLTIMLALHVAFRRDLSSLARAARLPGLGDPQRRRAVAAGWETFKRQLHSHHTGEDAVIWPALRQRLAHSEQALSTLDEMEAEHALVDPLLAAVDAAFSAEPAAGAPAPGDAVDALASTLTEHLAHEERDALPLIGVALSMREWRGVGMRLARQNGLGAGAEMFPWMLDGAPSDQVRAALSQLPPPVRVIYRLAWKPRYGKTARW